MTPRGEPARDERLAVYYTVDTEVWWSEQRPTEGGRCIRHRRMPSGGMAEQCVVDEWVRFVYIGFGMCLGCHWVGGEYCLLPGRRPVGRVSVARVPSVYPNSTVDSRETRVSRHTGPTAYGA